MAIRHSPLLLWPTQGPATFRPRLTNGFGFYLTLLPSFFSCQQVRFILFLSKPAKKNKKGQRKAEFSGLFAHDCGLQAVSQRKMFGHLTIRVIAMGKCRILTYHFSNCIFPQIGLFANHPSMIESGVFDYINFPKPRQSCWHPVPVRPTPTSFRHRNDEVLAFMRLP